MSTPESVELLLRKADAVAEFTTDYVTIHHGGRGRSYAISVFSTPEMAAKYGSLRCAGDGSYVADLPLNQKVNALLVMLSDGYLVGDDDLAIDTANLEQLLQMAEGSLTFLITCCSVEAHLPYGNIYVYRTKSEEEDGKDDRQPCDVSYVVDVDLNSRILFLIQLVEKRLQERTQ